MIFLGVLIGLVLPLLVVAAVVRAGERWVYRGFSDDAECR